MRNIALYVLLNLQILMNAQPKRIIVLTSPNVPIQWEDMTVLVTMVTVGMASCAMVNAT